MYEEIYLLCAVNVLSMIVICHLCRLNKQSDGGKGQFTQAVFVAEILVVQLLSQQNCTKFQTCSKTLRYRGDKSYWKSHQVYTCDFEVATFARQKLHHVAVTGVLCKTFHIEKIDQITVVIFNWSQDIVRFIEDIKSSYICYLSELHKNWSFNDNLC